jgi:2-methylcitrate dehydratase
MEILLQQIADHVCRLRYMSMSPELETLCRHRMVDVMGCALAATEVAPVRMARALALRPGLRGPASLIGTTDSSSVEWATLVNGLAIRYHDGADTFPGGGGHPSDCWAGLLALAQQQGSDLGTTFRAAVTAYEVFYALFKGGQLRDRGIDNVFYVSLATAAGAGQLLGLKAEQIHHAMAMLISGNLALGVSRAGALSMWKSGASAHAAMNAVIVTLLAQQGMQGPSLPLSGRRGLFELIGPFELAPLGDGSQGAMAMARSDMKAFLCDYHSQTPILAALQLYQALAQRSIERVDIQTYPFALSEAADDPAKWHPLNRETADHSMPWIVAGVLLQGRFSEQLYEPSALNDPRMHALTDRITVRVAEDLRDRFPLCNPCRINLRTTCGVELSASEDLPLGHHLRPMTTEQVHEKFLALTASRLQPARAQRLLDWIWTSPAACKLDGLFALAG